MADSKLKNVIVRTLSGAVYVALIVVATLYPIVMIPLMCLLTVIGLVEYFKMMDAQNPDRLLRNILITFVVFLYLLIFASAVSPMLPIGPYQQFHYAFFLFLLLAVVSLCGKQESAARQVGLSLFALCWLVLPLSLMTDACLNDGQGRVVLFTFVLVWINDTFAYLGGSMYGRHKMVERISPNKTWEGTLTGFVFTMVASVLAGYFWGGQIFLGATFHWYGWLLFGLTVSLLATMGDLLESWLKRQAGVKDSGKIMPGHGGVLDRLDSILLTVYPVITVLEVLLML
ncbi:MAG: phosphatidate cytidylyltransferase [Bacteroidales bacterium]|nr:phosphatidate cytidylyltransferase [Bacteroidales bacterium]